MATETATPLASHNDRLKIFLHALLFVAGSLFATGLLITCAGGKSPVSGDAGVRAGGDARAAGGTVWEYARASSVEVSSPTPFYLPNGVTQTVDCSSTNLPPPSSMELEVCFLNKVAAEG